jgi:hypothetical protein
MTTGISSDDERTIDRAYDLFRNKMVGHQDDTLQKIKSAARTELGNDLMRMISYDNRTEEYVRDWIALEPFRAENNFPRTQGVLLSLDLFPNLAPQSEEAKRHEQLKAITRVTMHFNSDKGTVTVARSGAFKNTRLYITDEGIRSLLTDHEYPSAVAALIIERNLTEYDQIAGVISAIAESEASVLTAGVL